MYNNMQKYDSMQKIEYHYRETQWICKVGVPEGEE